MRTLTLPVCALLLAALLYGCVGLNAASVVSSVRADPKSGTYIESVPFFAQSTQMCGPSALASIVNFYRKEDGGSEVSVDEIASAVYSKKLKGTLPPDMLIYLRKSGFNAEFYSGGLDDLKERLNAGRPLILPINLGLDIYPVGHYIVVTGYSESERAVIAHSGLEKDKAFSYAELVRAWKKTGYSTLIITPAAGR